MLSELNVNHHSDSPLIHECIFLVSAGTTERIHYYKEIPENNTQFLYLSK